MKLSSATFGPYCYFYLLDLAILVMTRNSKVVSAWKIKWNLSLLPEAGSLGQEGQGQHAPT